MMKELKVGSWDKVPERKLDETAASRLMEFTKWRRLVLPAHKQALPERWENRTQAWRDGIRVEGGEGECARLG